MLATIEKQARASFEPDQETASDNYISRLSTEHDPDTSWASTILTELYIIQKVISNRIAEVNEIEYIYYGRDGDVNYVWIIINELRPEVRNEIYKKEMDIIDFLHAEIFDFHVIARMNKPVDSIISQDQWSLIYNR